MPADRGPRVESTRFEPYPSHPPSGETTHAHRGPNTNKENEAPSTSGAASKTGQGSRSSTSKSKSPSTKKGPSTSSPDRSNLPENYLDIVLEEKLSEGGSTSEVPCYEDAAAVRRKLKSLIEKKVKIPCSDKTFNQTTLSKELQEIAKRTPEVRCANHQMSSGGPSPRSLSNFLKKTGSMGGGDSESYYFGHMLLEKMRIWNGEKKTAARKKAEENYPRGRVRLDPATARILCRADERPSRSEVAKWGR